MQAIKINLRETGRFTPLFLDYIENKSRLEGFYGLRPELSAFKEQIAKKRFPAEGREILRDVLLDQYPPKEIHDAVTANIHALSEKTTFTVTTGHQLNIFTGPMYFHYKIITVINLARALNRKYPEYHFVPLYWMASEDHDFEEINHFYLFGKKYEWKTDQRGPTGKFNTASLQPLIEKLPETPDPFSKAYLKHKTLADATRCIVNELYGSEGLVVLNADHPALKARFNDIIKDDLLHYNAGMLVKDTSARMISLGYKPQVYAREINLFYMEENLRERIVKENGRYSVLNTDISFSKERITDLTEHHPEKFSPNVLLRTLYQERILPNLAYVGGQAEINYWLQLKALFDHYGETFPILIPRNFALFVDKSVMKRLEKLKLVPEKLFSGKNTLKNLYLKSHSPLVYDITKEKTTVHDAFDKMKSIAAKTDPSLEGFVAAEMTRSIKAIRGIEKRLRKAAEKKENTGLRQLDQILERLFPGGELQERKINFLNFWWNDQKFLTKIMHVMKPVDFVFHILLDDE